MKIAFAVLAVLALSNPLEALTVPRTGDGALADEIQDFVDILPIDDMLLVVLEYIEKDQEVQLLVGYLLSDDFRNLVSDIEAIPEFIEVINYMQGAGLDAYAIVNLINDTIGLKRLAPPNGLYKIGGGIRGLIDDIRAIFPLQKIKALYKEKMATSNVFRGVINVLSSPASQKVVNSVCSNPNFHSLLVKAKGHGVDVAAVKRVLELILGVNVPCRV